ncbi:MULTISPECIES: hypothetical protein [Streptomyces]|uniref:Uncharacterized protein n=1 Tax=Streptomyces cacaoi TaxID=1898 RepID=A0A4Y3QU16_STRCI|nr:MULTISPECIES: hypothetical protein [Streptomyces]NNG89886.1 hypothetical protein [Streptomyces cacaoi]QHF95043.1 hypothetical protein DEH18_15575 [Streptomyces sp. NHF165]GEB48449.1 hypothetical protein SCA03_10000 [Streptomyces cacaoi]
MSSPGRARPAPGRRPGPRRRLGVVVLAGWLFADLLLVLALVSMADRPDPLADERPGKHHREKPSERPSASPTPKFPRAVARTPQEFRVSGTDRKSLIAQLKKDTEPWKGRSAALVLTFGGTASGTKYAHLVNSLLAKARPDMFGKDTATDDFFKVSDPPSTALLRVYFYTAPR